MSELWGGLPPDNHLTRAPDPLLGLVRLARGRMQHILETATAAMTGAEVRMTRDVIAQMDIALNPISDRELDAARAIALAEAPKAEEGKPCR